MRGLAVETDAARTSAGHDAHEDNNAVARVKKAFRLKPPFPPNFLRRGDPPLQPNAAAEDLRALGIGVRNTHLKSFIETLAEGVLERTRLPLSQLSEEPVRAVDELEVFLRHRPPSIPPGSTLRVAGACSLFPRTQESENAEEGNRKQVRWLDVLPVRITALDARGPGLRGPTAIGALAAGASALGAVAIGRLGIGRAAIKRLELDELEIRHLRVVDLEVVSERPRQAAGAAPGSEPASEPPAGR
jgi:hypothetical protein